MPRADQHPLELRRLPHELQVLRPAAEPHHPLDAGPVVPGPVEQHDLAGRRQVRDVALEVPLGRLPLARLLQRHHPGAARVEVLHEPLDGAALAGGVAPLEQDHQPLARLLDPVLQLQQLDLQQPLGVVVLVARHPVVVGVVLAPRVHRLAVAWTSMGSPSSSSSTVRPPRSSSSSVEMSVSPVLVLMRGEFPPGRPGNRRPGIWTSVFSARRSARDGRRRSPTLIRGRGGLLRPTARGGSCRGARSVGVRRSTADGPPGTRRRAAASEGRTCHVGTSPHAWTSVGGQPDA